MKIKMTKKQLKEIEQARRPSALEGVKMGQAFAARNTQMRIFFSYSREDGRFVGGVHERLSELLTEIPGRWTLFIDQDVEAVSRFGEVISDEIQRADAFLVFLSPSFLESDYCMRFELQAMCDRAEAGSSVLLPVHVRKVSYDDAPRIGEVQFVERDGYPFVDQGPSDSAVQDCASALARELDRLSGPIRGGQRRVYIVPSASALDLWERAKSTESALRFWRRHWAREGAASEDDRNQCVERFLAEFDEAMVQTGRTTVDGIEDGWLPYHDVSEEEFKRLFPPLPPRLII